MSSEHEVLLWLHVEHPGGIHARYATQQGHLRLVEVGYPEARYPGDLCRVEETLAEQDASLGALLLGNVSHPAACQVLGRPLGLIEIDRKSVV